MSDKKTNACLIRVRAVMGIGVGDTFTPVEVPDEGELEKTLEAIDGVPELSEDYACTDAYVKGFAMPEVVKKDADRELEETLKRIGDTPALYIVKEPGTQPSAEECIGKPSLEYAAVWAPNRKEWIGIKVERTRIMEGFYIDQRVECEGPFRLEEGWGKKISEAYNSKKSLEPRQVLHTEPSLDYFG